MATKIERILAPARGLNTFDAPHAVAKDQAPILKNFVPGQAGRIAGRNVIEGSSQLTAAVATAGMTSSGRVDSTCAVYPFGSLLVVSSDAKTSVFNPSSSTPVATLSPHGLYAWGGSGLLQDKIFVTDEAASPPTINSINSAGAAVVLTSAPKNPTHIFGYLDALWAFGARDTPAASSTDEVATLFFTNPGDTIDATAAPWQTNGLTNKIQVGSNVDPAVAGIPFKRSVLLLKENSIYQMIGSSPENFEIKLVSDAVRISQGIIPATSDTFVYFTTSLGIYRWDGTNISPMPHAVREAVRESTEISYLGYGRVLFGGSTGSFVFDESTDTLTEITFHGNLPNEANATTEAAGAATEQSLYRVVRLNTFTGCYGLAGFYTAGFGMSDRSFVTLRAGALEGRTAVQSVSDYGYKDAALAAGTYGSGNTSIVYHFRSRTIRSGSPLQVLRLARLYVDYVCQTAIMSDAGAGSTSIDSDNHPFLYVRIVSEDGVELLAETPLPSQGLTTSLLRKRAIFELSGVEAAEYYIEIYSKEANNLKTSADFQTGNLIYAKPTTLEVSDVWVEYEEAQRRVAV